jgi:hypothetical protein
LPTANAARPALLGNIDAYVTKLNAAGGFIYSTYFGGSDGGYVPRFEVDASGNAYIAGSNQSGTFPTLNAVQPVSGGYLDGSVTKLNPAGGIIYATYLGGSGVEHIFDFAVDAGGGFAAKIADNQAPTVVAGGPYSVNAAAEILAALMGP